MSTKNIGAVQRSERQRIEVSVSGGPDKGKSVVLFDEPLIVGSGPDADLRLSDDTVSAAHCELSWRDGRLVVVDLQSTNGVLIDGLSVSVAYPQRKCKVQLAQTTLTLKPLGMEEVLVSGLDHFGPLYGKSPAMRALFAQLGAVAQSAAPVLLEGETGTGKDLTAQAIHDASPRADGPFVVFDCAAVAGALLEGELFGHERGAFTGANQARDGLAQTAHGGTLLIDEVGELPLELQPKLLRLLERHEVRRLGANQSTQVDVRIIGATHRALRTMVTKGTFREDLFFRLSALKVRVPSLRERPDDIPGLVDKLLVEQGSNRRFAQLAEGDQSLLLSHRWPGNVRELRNAIDRLLVFRSVSALGLEEAEAAAPAAARELLPLSTARSLASDAFERRYLEDLLGRTQGNVTEAARRAEVSRQFLQRLMRKHGMVAGTAERP